LLTAGDLSGDQQYLRGTQHAGLSGTFDQRVSVEEAASAALVGVALLGLWSLRRRALAFAHQGERSPSLAGLN
jgi:hypothetical protein